MIGIVYGSSTLNTEFVSEKLVAAFGGERAARVNVRDVTPEQLAAFDNLVLVTSTWGAGDLQDDWEERFSDLLDRSFDGVVVGLVGLGDQKNYPDRFCDGIGILYEKMVEAGAHVVGQTSADGYEYKRSGAERNGSFVGLVLDEDNQGDLTDDRIRDWVKRVAPKLC